MARKKKYMRRPNGSGSVYKLSGNRRRPWIAIKTKGWDENGKQIKDIIGYFEERDEALLALLTHEPTETETSSTSTVNKNTTVEQLYELIYAEAEKENRTKSTLDGLKASYRAIEELKDKPLYNLSSMDFQDIIDELIEDPKASSSFSKLNKIKSLISSMYKVLMKHKVIEVNHAQFISLRGAKDGNIPAFPEKDIDTLFKNDKDRIAKSSLILAYTGFRISEFLNLEKKYVDLDRGIIIGGSKTEAGKDRIVIIHSKIKKYIEYFYNEFPDCELLFSRNGEKVTGSYYREYYHQPLVKKLGLSNLNPHSFRHTTASKMRMAGVDDKALMEIIGHTDIKFTDKKYVDVDIEYLRQQMEKVK